MALKNDGSRMFDYNGNYEISSLILFAQSERRMKEKKAAIEDLQNEYDLLEQQAFNLYKSHVYYFKLDISLINKSQQWLSMLHKGTDADGKKLDGRRKYDEKEIFEVFHETLQEYLGIDDMEIDHFIDFNFGQANDVVFTSHGHKWYLEIPNVSKINLESFRRYGDSCFKLRICHYDSEHYTSSVDSTFNEEDLKDIMQKGIDKFCQGKDVKTDKSYQ